MAPWFVLITSACADKAPLESGAPPIDSDPGPTVDSPPVETETETESEPDTEETGGSELACADAASSVSARLHGEIQSLVYVSWEQATAATAWVSYRFDGASWATTPAAVVSPGPVELLVLGVPYASDVTYRVVLDCGDDPVDAAEGAIRTGPLPASLPLPTVVVSDPAAWDPDDVYLYTSIAANTGGWTAGPFWKLIFDRAGRVVWAHETADSHWTIFTDVSRDGADLMFDDAVEWLWGTEGPGYVHRMKIDGTIVRSYETDGLHHAWVELADGTIAWGRRISQSEEWLELLRPDGSIETAWTCSAFELEQLGRTGTSCHSNSWYWHEPTNTFLVSFPSTAGLVRDTVLHLDASGNTLDTWGYVSDWLFDPADATFDYQHGVSFTDTGTLLLSTKLPDFHPLYDRSNDTLAVREYALDPATRTLTQVWAFGEDQGIAGDTAGEAHRLANGNTLHNFGSGARVREITAAGELVWDVSWPGGDTGGPGRLQGRSVFVQDWYAFAP